MIPASFEYERAGSVDEAVALLGRDEDAKLLAGGHSLGLPTRRPDVTLPPGQHRIDGFPRFGTHLARPAPAVPIVPVIEISGAVAKSVALPLAALAYPAAAPSPLRPGARTAAGDPSDR